ncbi:hypothetical protein DPX39_110071000 [Trypanosoma brucei equiperdum]|uniref:Uncharacterized protein n=1 Tax=Trypanosoma brucei equiperdum TaxID=630700 RepID=A0A3L6KZE8_9TRYP|nr:hypothetical protein DPX39_110071000 [Trypanosoma brucei equiperdum]
MVLLSVKGTTFPDEFVYECTAATAIYPDLARNLCHIQNSRHLVKLILLSARELLDEARCKKRVEVVDEGPGDGGANSYSVLLTEYGAIIESTSARLKDRVVPVSLEEFDQYADRLRELTERLYPEECCVPEGGRSAAVDRLYQLHDDPNLDEDRRLAVYHCRAILDPQWKSHEQQKEDKAGLWFCGKLMEDTIARYSGKNEKSRLTVKVHPKDSVPPSTEPRISYDDQRALYERMRTRREEYKGLEESELRDRVVAQARGKVALTAPAAASPAMSMDLSRLRPICPKREEHEVN